MCLIIDVAVPSDYKATEKMTKHVDLQIECKECGIRQ